MPTTTMTATTAHVLRPIADALVFLTNTTVHPTLFPYLWGPTLHAARYVSISAPAMVAYAS